MLKREYVYHNRVSKPKTDKQEQYAEIDEFIFKKCRENGINWRTLQFNEKLKLAEQYGCKREYADSIL